MKEQALATKDDTRKARPIKKERQELWDEIFVYGERVSFVGILFLKMLVCVMYPGGRRLLVLRHPCEWFV